MTFFSRHCVDQRNDGGPAATGGSVTRHCEACGAGRSNLRTQIALLAFGLLAMTTFAIERLHVQ